MGVDKLNVTSFYPFPAANAGDRVVETGDQSFDGVEGWLRYVQTRGTLNHFQLDRIVDADTGEFRCWGWSAYYTPRAALSYSERSPGRWWRRWGLRCIGACGESCRLPDHRRILVMRHLHHS